MAVIHKNPRFQKLIIFVVVTTALIFVLPRKTQYMLIRPSSTTAQNVSSSEISYKAPKRPSKPYRPPALDRLQGWISSTVSQSKKPRYSLKPISYIFPAYHAFPENDKIWGPNWTEWDNVRKLTHNKYGLELVTPSAEIGFYNGATFETRKRQADYLRDSGFYGICFHHYWFSGKPTMDAVLQGMLHDGEPNMPFMLSWANEPWTSRWDGANGETYLAQDYGEVQDWRLHFDWLLPFFKHPKYIRSEGKIQFIVYDLQNIGRIANRMFPAWRQWAIEEGLGGMDIIETRKNEYRDDEKAPPDAVNEFQPHAANNLIHAHYHATRRNSRVYHRGSMVCWDSTPRHVTDGLAPINPLCHPMNWQYHVVEILGKIKSDPNPIGVENLFFVNALNEWGEGCALEPSAQFGDGYGRAMKNALTISEEIHHWAGDLITEGLERNLAAKSENSSRPDVCVIVRTTSTQHDWAIYNLRTMLASLHAQDNKNWNALVIQTDQGSFDNIQELVYGLLDSRIKLAWALPEDFKNSTDDADYAAMVTDWAIQELERLYPSCASAKYLLLSEGKDTYEPSAFDIVSQSSGDLIGLNYESHRTIWHEVVHGERCVQFQSSPIHMYEASEINVFSGNPILTQYSHQNIFAPAHLDMRKGVYLLDPYSSTSPNSEMKAPKSPAFQPQTLKAKMMLL